MPKLKIVLTGASGFVGRQLVQYLDRPDIELLLVGRDVTKLCKAFPNIAVCNYDELTQRARNFDLLVHLAVLNNTSNAAASVYDDVNVGFLADVLDQAKRAGVVRFLNVSTFHAVDSKVVSPYAKSKRRAVEVVDGVSGIEASTVFLPIVYGEEFAGRLQFLNSFPLMLVKPTLHLVSSLLPTVHISKLAGYVVEQARLNTTPEDVMLSDQQSGNLVFHLFKRLLDVSFALFVLMFFWWLIIGVWLLIKATSPGPGLFAQQRVGRFGTVFTCYKFRTMSVGTKQAASHEVSVSSITNLGAVLRNTKLDELPQIWNILRGQMSLVGPRPCLPSQTDLIDRRAKKGVMEIMPGISGLAQVARIDMSDPERLAKRDAEYLARRSILLEIKIVIATVLGQGRGDNLSNSAKMS